MNKGREAGDPIPKEVIRDLRVRHGLSQDQLAQRLGVKGGKSVISAWESGRASCEGPAAELLLLLFGLRGGSVSVAQMIEEAERTWRRAPTYSDAWRQITAVPDEAIEIDRARFGKLFPGVEIPPNQHAHGFPTIDHDLPANVYGISPSGWYGVVPVERERAPQWLWILKRGGEFCYREVPWEDKPGAVTMGHIHIGSLLALGAQTIFFLRRLAKECEFSDALGYTLQLDLEGVAGRGLVGYRPIPTSEKTKGFFPVDEPKLRSSENRLSATVRTTIGAMEAEPLKVTYELVGEMALLLRPDLVEPKTLADQLRRRHAQDVDGGKYRWLGFLDSIMGKK